MRHTSQQYYAYVALKRLAACRCARADPLPSSIPQHHHRASTVSKPTTAVPTAATGGNGPKRGTYPIVDPIFKDVCELQGITLTRYMMEVARANPHLTEIESLMNSIQTATKYISSLVERACITGMTGYKDEGCSINVQVRGAAFDLRVMKSIDE